MVNYKAVLKEWHKGTGGGSGLATEFEGWSDAKLQRYDIDIDNYDHTDVSSRPAVLINGYCKQRIPYLTAIHLWDKSSDYLLSSRHDPLIIGLGEGGFDVVNEELCNTSDSSPASKRRVRKCKKMSTEPSPNGIAAIIKSVIDLCNDNSNLNGKEASVGVGNKNIKETSGLITIENLSLPELYLMIEQHKLHMNFLKENDMLLDGKKEDIVGKISYIFEIIEGRRQKKRKCGDDDDINGDRKVSS